MYARSAVKPERRLVHAPTLHPFPGEGGQIRFVVLELGPGRHEHAAQGERRPAVVPGVGFGFTPVTLFVSLDFATSIPVRRLAQLGEVLAARAAPPC